MTSRAKKRKFVIWEGDKTRRWFAGKKQRNKMGKDESLIKEKDTLLKNSDDIPSRKVIGKLVAKTANEVMKFNPTAIIL